MASTMIGRSTCPECGFEAAHVKRSEKCLYRYCPECCSQHMARSARQVADLMAKTRPVDGVTPVASAPPAVPDLNPKRNQDALPLPPPAPTAAPKRLFGF